MHVFVMPSWKWELPTNEFSECTQQKNNSFLYIKRKLVIGIAPVLDTDRFSSKVDRKIISLFCSHSATFSYKCKGQGLTKISSVQTLREKLIWILEWLKMLKATAEWACTKIHFAFHTQAGFSSKFHDL